MIAFITILNFFILVIVVLDFRATQQIEYLLTHIKERLNQMPNKADLEAKIVEVNAAIDTGFDSLAALVTAEVQQVKDAIAAGADTTATIAALDAMETKINTKLGDTGTAISDIVTPAP